MPGAGKRRGANDRKNARNPAQEQPPVAAPGQNDGPSSQPPGPPSAGRAAGRGRPPPNVPQPPNAPSTTQSIRSGSHDPSASGAPDAPQQLKRDPARDYPMVLNRNVDFAGNAYNLINQMPTTLMARPKFNTSGKPASININSHKILEYPKKKVYQYDVVIGSGAEKRGLIKSVWESKVLQAKLGQGFIFDGNKIGWSMTDFEPITLIIDLDQERGIVPRVGRTPNQHRVMIRKTSVVNLYAITAYLAGESSFDTPVLEAINFMDHLLRETPSKTHIPMRRSYFGRNTEERMLLGAGVEAMKGVYQSIRAAQGRRLVVNVDVSNTCFWHETVISQLSLLLTRASSHIDLVNKLAPVKNVTGSYRESQWFSALKRLHKNEINIFFRGCPESIQKKIFKIHRISDMTARTYKFDATDKATGETIPEMTVEQYFKKKYNISLEFPDLPLVETNRKGVYYPMEVCHMRKGQKYPYKLDEIQTANMIKFAVSRPAVRKDSIQRGLQMLDWEQDPFLRNYGLRIDNNMLKTEARILPPPEVAYKNDVAKPGFTGRWDLRGKVFLEPNPAELKAWGVCIVGRPQNIEMVNVFIKNFIKVYRGHGGYITNPDPLIIQGGPDGAKCVENLFQAVGNKHQVRPQLFFFILPTKNAEMYNRIKKSADCRYGVVSQCVQLPHVLKNAAQYHSNVAMKVNAKLGGTTCRVAMRGKASPFEKSTMIIGADVSHAAPGSQGASFAAITMSMDKLAARYAAAVETNGVRVEMIATRNMEDMIKPLIQNWCETVGGGRLPEHIYYFRDGVSEGQYQNVLTSEVADIKRIINEFGKHNPKHNVKYTVVVAEKRHHIRFFPNGPPGADRNGNPVPGTLVEKDVTHPFEYDFYLCSHAAIQGTARPTHYHILMDECNLAGDKFQTMLYEHSYQYMRATTPVSLFPAVYYAHLASNRARSHLDMSETAIQAEKSGKSSSEKPDTETKPLISMANQTGIRWTMWYI